MVATVTPVLRDLAAAPDTTAAAGDGADRVVEIRRGAAGELDLLDDGELVRGDVDPDLLAATVVWHLNTVAAGGHRHLVLHAGAVAGDAVAILPGVSGAGKSTLVAACVAAGSTYLSDEYAVLDLATGRVVPYPKPIAGDAERLVVASTVGPGVVAAAPLPVGGVVLPRHVAGAVPARTPLDPGAALLALAAHTTNLTGVGARGFAWLAGIAASVPAVEVVTGTAARPDDPASLAHDPALAPALDAVQAATAAPSAPVEPAPVLEPVTPTTVTVTVGDGLAVLDATSGAVHLLNHAAAFVWACVPDAPDADGLARLAAARAPAGRLDEPSARATVAHLAETGLLPASGSSPRSRQ